MQKFLKFILITLFCVSTIKSACTATDVSKSVCETDTTCKWEQTTAGSCTGDGTCGDYTDSSTCSGSCTWNEAKGTCSDKACAEYTSEPTCSAVSTCEWKNNACSTKTDTTTTPTTDDDEDDGVFRLKSSILIFLISFIF